MLSCVSCPIHRYEIASVQVLFASLACIVDAFVFHVQRLREQRFPCLWPISGVTVLRYFHESDGRGILAGGRFV